MIITDKNKLLKECQDVSLIEVDGIVYNLEQELMRSPLPGVGLAANQIGLDKKVCIIRCGKHALNLANPKIVDKYDLALFRNEGCLSFPDQWVTTARYSEIVVEDLLHPAGIICTGMTAVVVQHEIGHLYGETMYDYEIEEPKGPNMLCWCGSERKFKKCHMNKEIKTLV